VNVLNEISAVYCGMSISVFLPLLSCVEPAKQFCGKLNLLYRTRYANFIWLSGEKAQMILCISTPTRSINCL